MSHVKTERLLLFDERDKTRTPSIRQAQAHISQAVADREPEINPSQSI